MPGAGWDGGEIAIALLYNPGLATLSDGEVARMSCDEFGRVLARIQDDATVEISSGAVELKNSDTDDRAKINTDGSLFTTNVPVAYDTKVVDEVDPNNVTITYKLSGDTVATKTIAVSGTTTTITFALA